jgi:chromate transporter
MNSPPNLLELSFYFAALSLVAVGGANAVIPDMHRQFVDVQQWMSGAEFVQLVALAQAAPGPNVLIVTLLGWKIAGLAGALAATAAMCVPSSLLAYGVSRVWDRYRHTRWHETLRTALAPITVGLVIAAGYVLTRIADDTWVAYAITATTVVIVVATEIHPLWLLGAAGMIGYVGLV